MITIENHAEGNTLVIDGQRMLTEEDGHFRIPYAILRDEDMSVLPTGKFIEVDYKDAVKSTAENPVRVKIMEILPQGRAHVFCEYFHCPSRWEEAMGSEKFADTEQLIFLNNPGIGRFDVKGVMTDDEGKPKHYVDMEVDIGSLKTIGLRVVEALEGLLKSVKDNPEDVDDDEAVEDDE